MYERCDAHPPCSVLAKTKQSKTKTKQNKTKQKQKNVKQIRMRRFGVSLVKVKNHEKLSLKQ